MSAPLRVLVLTDDESDERLIREELRRAYDADVKRAASAAELEARLTERWDIVFSAYEARGVRTVEALRFIQELGLDLPLVVISGELNDAAVARLLRAGAADFVTRDNPRRLNVVVSRELLAAQAGRERARLEEQLWHAQKMEAVGRLAGGMAHDFNNLLTVITGYSDLLLAGSGLKENQRTALMEIRRAAERGGALTQQLLTFSRRQPMAAKELRVNDLVVNLQKMVRRLIGEDIEMVTLPAATEDLVHADQGRLEQVIMNLVVNARDAMPKGGKLTIETATVRVSEGFAAKHIDLKPGPHVMLSVSDTGVGMDAETQRHLFEPFYTTKAPGKGTGLGLATVYAIVRQSEGAISVHSEKGKGTVMKVYLPLVQAPAPLEAPQEKAGPAAEPPLTGKETILLVEDEARVRKLISDVLESRGYAVLEGSRGEEALRLAVTHKGDIDLIIADVVMPEMSGPEVVEQIRAMRPESRVLYISGYTDEAIVRHGILESGAAFLQKPFLPGVLARKVREVLDAPAQAGANGE